jgi:hypothetical protein
MILSVWPHVTGIPLNSACLKKVVIFNSLSPLSDCQPRQATPRRLTVLVYYQVLESCHTPARLTRNPVTESKHATHQNLLIYSKI